MKALGLGVLLSLIIYVHSVNKIDINSVDDITNKGNYDNKGKQRTGAPAARLQEDTQEVVDKISQKDVTSSTITVADQTTVSAVEHMGREPPRDAADAVVITKKTSKSEGTPKKPGKSTGVPAGQTTTEESPFAADYGEESGESSEESREESTRVRGSSTTIAATSSTSTTTEEVKETTTSSATTTRESTTGSTNASTTTTTLKSTDDEKLSAQEELRLLKKLSAHEKGRPAAAFGVKQAELTAIHNIDGLNPSLPPFAFSEDENDVDETEENDEQSVQVDSWMAEVFAAVLPGGGVGENKKGAGETGGRRNGQSGGEKESTAASAVEKSSEKTLEKSATPESVKATEATTATSTTPTTTTVRVIKKQEKSHVFPRPKHLISVNNYASSKFKTGQNYVPLRIFFNTGPDGTMIRRKYKESNNERKDSSGGVVENQTRNTVAVMDATSGEPRVTNQEARAAASTTENPAGVRTDDFLVDVPDRAMFEKNVPSKPSDEQLADTVLGMMGTRIDLLANSETTHRTTMSPNKNGTKHPDKEVLPQLLAMPSLKDLNSFGSLRVPLHVNGFSQQIRPQQESSEFAVSDDIKSKTSGMMGPRRRVKKLRKKNIDSGVTVEKTGETESKTVQVVDKVATAPNVAGLHKKPLVWPRFIKTPPTHPPTVVQNQTPLFQEPKTISPPPPPMQSAFQPTPLQYLGVDGRWHQYNTQVPQQSISQQPQRVQPILSPQQLMPQQFSHQPTSQQQFTPQQQQFAQQLPVLAQPQQLQQQHQPFIAQTLPRQKFRPQPQPQQPFAPQQPLQNQFMARPQQQQFPSQQMQQQFVPSQQQLINQLQREQQFVGQAQQQQQFANQPQQQRQFVAPNQAAQQQNYYRPVQSSPTNSTTSIESASPLPKASETQAKILRSADPTGAEESFAKSVLSSPIAIVRESLMKIKEQKEKMKQKRRRLRRKNQKKRARARAAGKTFKSEVEETVTETNVGAAKPHDGEVHLHKKALPETSQSADQKVESVVDHDRSRGTIDRDARS